MLSVISEIRTIHGDEQGTRGFHDPELSMGNEAVAEAFMTISAPENTTVMMKMDSDQRMSLASVTVFFKSFSVYDEGAPNIWAGCPQYPSNEDSFAISKGIPYAYFNRTQVNTRFVGCKPDRFMQSQKASSRGELQTSARPQGREATKIEVLRAFILEESAKSNEVPVFQLFRG